jgi:hypothetical protein
MALSIQVQIGLVEIVGDSSDRVLIDTGAGAIANEDASVMTIELEGMAFDAAMPGAWKITCHPKFDASFVRLGIATNDVPVSFPFSETPESDTVDTDYMMEVILKGRARVRKGRTQRNAAVLRPTGLGLGLVQAPNTLTNGNGTNGIRCRSFFRTQTDPSQVAGTLIGGLCDYWIDGSGDLCRPCEASDNRGLHYNVNESTWVSVSVQSDIRHASSFGYCDVDRQGIPKACVLYEGDSYGSEFEESFDLDTMRTCHACIPQQVPGAMRLQVWQRYEDQDTDREEPARTIGSLIVSALRAKAAGFWSTETKAESDVGVEEEIARAIGVALSSSMSSGRVRSRILSQLAGRVAPWLEEMNEVSMTDTMVRASPVRLALPLTCNAKCNRSSGLPLTDSERAIEVTVEACVVATLLS